MKHGLAYVNENQKWCDTTTCGWKIGHFHQFKHWWDEIDHYHWPHDEIESFSSLVPNINRWKWTSFFIGSNFIDEMDLFHWLKTWMNGWMDGTITRSNMDWRMNEPKWEHVDEISPFHQFKWKFALAQWNRVICFLDENGSFFSLVPTLVDETDLFHLLKTWMDEITHFHWLKH